MKGFFLFVQEVLVSDLTQLTLFDIRNQFYRRTMALDLASFNDQGSAELLARFTNDMDSLHQGLMTILGRVVREPLRIISCLGGALWLNWRLTCLALVLVPVSAFCTHRAGKIMKRAVRRSLESMSNIYKILQESLQGIKVVKAYTMERYERRRFFLETKSLYKKSVRVAMIDAMSDPVLEMLALTTVSIALLSGSYLVLYHATSINFGLFRLQLASKPLQIEDLLTLYAMLAGISDPVRKLANVHSKLQRAAAAADRICILMDRRPEVADKPRAIRLPRHRALIEFDNVTFGYNGRESILKGLSLNVRHGETIALVGPNGCGKSTLMNLIPRFWDVKSGSIRIDGHDIRDVSIRSLRSQIGMVIQETTLFNDTVANNLAYGNRHARREDIIAAAKRSYAHSFIMNLPDGYDTVLGEQGTGLSGGQRQRLALARAMLRDPSILILDEATSAVDIQDEALIRKAIEEFARNRTTFLITHSLSRAFLRRPDRPDQRRPDRGGRDRGGTPPDVEPVPPAPRDPVPPRKCLTAGTGGLSWGTESRPSQPSSGMCSAPRLALGDRRPASADAPTDPGRSRGSSRRGSRGSAKPPGRSPGETSIRSPRWSRRIGVAVRAAPARPFGPLADRRGRGAPGRTRRLSRDPRRRADRHLEPGDRPGRLLPQVVEVEPNDQTPRSARSSRSGPPSPGRSARSTSTAIGSRGRPGQR